jgi:hypothetical protein
MAEVDVDPGGVDPVLDSERNPFGDRLFQLPGEIGLGRDRVDPSAENLKLFGCADGHQETSVRRKGEPERRNDVIL